jgi:hypothetical protein
MRTQSNCVAVRRGGKQPKRTRQTATQVNTIRPQQTDEPAIEWRSPEVKKSPRLLRRDMEASAGAVGVVGGGMSGKGSAVNTGDLSGQETVRSLAGVRAVIVAMKPSNAGGAKGGRKVRRSDVWRGHNIGVSALRAKQAKDKISCLKTRCWLALGAKVMEPSRQGDILSDLLRAAKSGREARKGLSQTNTNWRAGCGKIASPVRRGERRNPMRRSYLYLGLSPVSVSQGHRLHWVDSFGRGLF